MLRFQTPAARPAPSLLFVNQHYWPDVASTGQHLTDLAEHLVGEGYVVEVLCSRGKYVAGRMAVPDRETRHGVAIRRVRTTAFGRGKHLGRLLDYASYYVQVLARLLFGPRHTGVIFLTTPPLLATLGALARLIRGQRYAVWSMDLHPDAELASGMLPNGGPLAIVGRILEWLNAVGYRNADAVIDLGPYMKQRIVAKGVAPSRTHTVHVWSARDEVVPVPREENPLVDRLGLRDRFVVMYSGNAGIVHDFDGILDAMRRLSGDPRIHFLFVGSGPRRAEIERFAREHAIPNFEYREYFARDDLRWSLSVADVHLLSLREPFAGISVPGKLYGIMAAGRPAVFVGPERCESAETIRDARCGEVVPAEGGASACGERLATLLRELARRPDVLRAMGDAGRAAFETRYEREPNCRAFAAIVEGTWGGPEPAGAAILEPAIAAVPGD